MCWRSRGVSAIGDEAGSAGARLRASPHVRAIGRRLVVVVLAGAPFIPGSWATEPVWSQSPAERAAPASLPVSPIPIPEIPARAEDVMAHLRRRAEHLVEEQRVLVLGLQDRLVKEIGRCDEALATIDTEGIRGPAGAPVEDEVAEGSHVSAIP